jgi:3-hydroxyisobutyrate dehydrogenase-like beta-hydroxyacid dehydrogenase
MVTQDHQSLVIAVLGLGEAGSVIARDLTAAGTRVRGYDPAVTATGPVLDTTSEAEAAHEAQLVLSVNSAEAAIEAFKAGLPGLLADGQPRPDVLWADLNTASPGIKRQLAALAADAGVPFADVAMMAPVPGRGLRVPMLASGPGATRYAALLAPLGAGIEVLDGPAGLAASKKLLRSVFYKGMAASIVEALEAAGQRRQRIGLGVERQAHDDQVDARVAVGGHRRNHRLQVGVRLDAHVDRAGDLVHVPADGGAVPG